jgi:AcrR family transcriptional regulator
MPSFENADPTELRRHIVRSGVAAFRDAGAATVGVADVAQRAGLEVDEVVELFPSWDLLAIAVIDGWFGALRRDRMDTAETEGAVAYLRSLLETAQQDPALVRTRFTLMGAAADLAHPARGWYRAQYSQFVQDVALFFTRDVVAKREPRGVSPRSAAGQLVALFDGLELQSLMLDAVDLPVAWDVAVERLRAGWRA